MKAIKAKRQKPLVHTYALGDRYMIDGIVGVVRYVNNGYAWLCPVEYDPERGLHPCLAFERLDQHGNTQSGRPIGKKSEAV